MRKKAIEYVQNHFGLSQMNICKITHIAWTMARYIKKTDRNKELLEKMREILYLYPKGACPMLIMKLNQINFAVNHKRIVNMAVMVIKTVDIHGQQEFLAIEPMKNESEDTYMALFR